MTRLQITSTSEHQYPNGGASPFEHTRSKVSVDNLHGVTETLLLPLAIRADESCRADGLLRDRKAVELLNRINCDFDRRLRATHDQVPVAKRAREFDRCVRAFLREHPAGIVVDIGCGLDTRFWRVDNGTVDWYDLDLPEVIALRRELLDETSRCHFIGCSALDFAWMDCLSFDGERAYLFLAEGVFMFFEPEQTKRLLCALQERFPGSQLMFDAFTPFFVRISPWLHPALKESPGIIRGGLADSREPERWSESIKLLSEWFYFDQPEPRLGAMKLIRYLPGLSKGSKIVRYRLGQA